MNTRINSIFCWSTCSECLTTFVRAYDDFICLKLRDWWSMLIGGGCTFFFSFFCFRFIFCVWNVKGSVFQLISSDIFLNLWSFGTNWQPCFLWLLGSTSLHGRWCVFSVWCYLFSIFMQPQKYVSAHVNNLSIFCHSWLLLWGRHKMMWCIFRVLLSIVIVVLPCK